MSRSYYTGPRTGERAYFPIIGNLDLIDAKATRKFPILWEFINAVMLLPNEHNFQPDCVPAAASLVHSAALLRSAESRGENTVCEHLFE